MNTLEFFRTQERASVRAIVLLALAIAAGSATAQSGAAPDRVQSATPAANAVTTPVARQHDPFSPFVWDALGATPSIRLPGQRNAAPSKPATTERAPVTKEAQPAVTIERTETAAR